MVWDGIPRVADFRRLGLVFHDDLGAELRSGDPEHEALAGSIVASLLAQRNLDADPTEIPSMPVEYRPQVLS